MSSDQGRKAPAFQEYAATMLSNRNYKMADEIARGVLWSMRLELWENETLPSDPGALARILGLDPARVAAALPAVMPFFVEVCGEIRSQELDGYRAHLERRHLAQSEGGKRTAVTVNARGKMRRGSKTLAAKGITGDAANLSATRPASLSASVQLLSGMFELPVMRSLQSPVHSAGL